MNDPHNADISIGVWGAAWPFGRSARRGLWYGVLLSCLCLYAAGGIAEEPNASDLPVSQHQEVPGLPLPSDKLTAAMRASNNLAAGSQLEQTPQRIDWFKLQELKREEALNRDKSRKRVTLPPEAVAVGQSPEKATAYTTGSSSSGNWVPLFVGILFFIAAGAMAYHGFGFGVPGFTPTGLNPFLLDRALGTPGVPFQAGGDQFFSDFEARFRVDIRAPGAGEFAGLSQTDLFKESNRCIKRLRKYMREVRLNTEERMQRKNLWEIAEELRSIRHLASEFGSVPLQRITATLEALAEQLTEKTENISSSTIRTMTQGIELIADLCRPKAKLALLNGAPLRFLVVDDEDFGRIALSNVLTRMLTAPDVAEGAEGALKMAARHTYDVIFLDVRMPEMDGFELCNKIHETPLNKQTAVVFVTASQTFETRTKSIACGGRDLIAKPFLTVELTAKALIMASRERLRSRGNHGEVTANR